MAQLAVGSASNRMTGVVKWFNELNGYGFITPDNGSSDVYFHFSAIIGNGFKPQGEGQHVEFQISNTNGRTVAIDIKPLSRQSLHLEQKDGDTVVVVVDMKCLNTSTLGITEDRDSLVDECIDG